MQEQLTNDNKRVRYFLDALESQHPPLLVKTAKTEEENGITGKRNYFELALAYILQKDPVLKLQYNKNNKRSQSQISGTNTTGFGSKNIIGTSGVHLRWHAKSYYNKLIQYQKKDLW